MTKITDQSNSTTATVFDKMLEEISQNPEDWELRNILADHCEDIDRQGDADALRWSATYKKRAFGGVVSVIWFNEKTVRVETDPSSNLPDEVWKQIDCTTDGLHSQKRTTSTLLAEQLFIDAYKKAVALGWDPHKVGE